MPIVHFHLVDGAASAEAEARLLTRASELYARTLDAPMERVRAFITAHAPGRFATAGRLVSEGGGEAPYFEFFVLAGRPLAQRQALLAGFTDLLVDILGARRELVRGTCRQIAPEDWGIGGVPTSVLRASEIEARAQAATAG